jgi:maltooligosyltrehalose trehalohydrolase
MGEEYAERQPFQYFVSHHGEDLVNAVRAGRKEEFASFFHDNAAVPDPQSGQTYQDSKLRWSFVNDHEQFTMLQFYKRLIEVRKQSRILSSGDRERLAVAAYESERCLVVHRWSDTDHIICAFNFSGLPHTVNLPDVTQARCIVNSGDLLWMGGDKHAPAYSRALNLPPSRFLLFSTQHV